VKNLVRRGSFLGKANRAKRGSLSQQKKKTKGEEKIYIRTCVPERARGTQRRNRRARSLKGIELKGRGSEKKEEVGRNGVPGRHRKRPGLQKKDHNKNNHGGEKNGEGESRCPYMKKNATVVVQGRGSPSG